MKKTTIIIAAVVVLVIAGGAGAMLLNRSQSKPQNSVNQSSQNGSELTNGVSLRTLIDSGVVQQCTFTDNEVGNSGSVYFGNGSVRGDFTSQVNTQPVQSHMITDGDNIYVWMEGETQGFKASLESTEGAVGEEGKSTFDIDKQVNYSCSPWVVDNSMFNLPARVTFNDMSTLMENINLPTAAVSATQNNQAACSACNNLTGEAQAQCKTALKCN